MIYLGVICITGLLDEAHILHHSECLKFLRASNFTVNGRE